MAELAVETLSITRDITRVHEIQRENLHSLILDVDFGFQRLNFLSFTPRKIVQRRGSRLPKSPKFFLQVFRNFVACK